VICLASFGVVDEQVAGLAVDMGHNACLTALGHDLVADREVLRGEVHSPYRWEIWIRPFACAGLDVAFTDGAFWPAAEAFWAASEEDA
jgi:hypothetical protein